MPFGFRSTACFLGSIGSTALKSCFTVYSAEEPSRIMGFLRLGGYDDAICKDVDAIGRCADFCVF